MVVQEALLAFLFLVIAWVLLKKRLPRRRLDIKGKWVMITGCDSGIGLAVAHDLNRLSVHVIAACLSLDSPGSIELQRLDSRSMRVVQMDITDGQSVDEAMKIVEEVTSESGLWAVINNAGVCVFGEFDWLTMDQIVFQNSVNFVGTVRVIKKSLDLLKRSKGRIITITSVNGLVAYPGTSVYSATKFALEGFCDSIRNELHKLDVEVIIIEPGDFAKLTNIMRNHQTHVNEMWNGMTAENKTLYQSYFHKYHETAIKNAGYSSPKQFGQTSIICDVVDALNLEKPYPRVIGATLSVKMFVTILRILPTYFADRILRLVFSKAVNAEFKKS